MTSSELVARRVDEVKHDGENNMNEVERIIDQLQRAYDFGGA